MMTGSRQAPEQELQGSGGSRRTQEPKTTAGTQGARFTCNSPSEGCSTESGILAVKNSIRSS